ncbi:hypothetical protein O181_051433 [Austropuccinia psidii MF-1]|uniref:Secreted protein n=1 Tax=Austropuccinia psidii MF-1 TaxID=1389203 RepID=A0A9Q3HNC7_9BASI|nr:hypothetical protein [Austropuccinia psidii MF-1]
MKLTLVCLTVFLAGIVAGLDNPPNYNITCLNGDRVNNPTDFAACQGALDNFRVKNGKLSVPADGVSAKCLMCQITVTSGKGADVPFGWVQYALSYPVFTSKCSGPPMNVALTDPKNAINPIVVSIKAAPGDNTCSKD